jgi:hypothetical protein
LVGVLNKNGQENFGMNLPHVLPMIAVAAIVSTITGCVSKTALSSEQDMYLGRWDATGGRYIEIASDGGGSMKLPNASIKGGAVTITGTNLVIALGPIKQSFKITQVPTNTGGTWTMKLDEITYTREE